MDRRYVSAIKDKLDILKKKDPKLTRDAIDSHYSSIAEGIRSIEPFWEATPVNENTLKQLFDLAKKEWLSVNPVKASNSKTISQSHDESWLTEERRKAITWRYFERYDDYLRNKGRSKQVADVTKATVLDIVSRLGDPKAQKFFVKGLCNGEVQSGKTEKFNGVINAAIDAGYQLIIVLSGIMEDLRGQTQDRLEADVIGYGLLDSNGIRWSKSGKKGVGEISYFGMMGDEEVSVVEAITTCFSDFSTALARGASLNSPKILVCKKNVDVLKNVILWLGDLLEDSGTEKLPFPLLIIDDEADNASLNNLGFKGREEASKINGHIRAVLGSFDRKSYLAFTASPFANVLADRNEVSDNKWSVKSLRADKEREFDQVANLFPDDFIIRFESPSNYIGAKNIFETVSEVKKLPIITLVDDAYLEFPTRLLKETDEPVEDIDSEQKWNEKIQNTGQYYGFTEFREFRRKTRASTRHDNFPQKLPKSLEEAVLSFILANALREYRKREQVDFQNFEPHNTLLVHVSRFTPWQNKTKELIKTFVSKIEYRLEQDQIHSANSIYTIFENIWNDYFYHLNSNIHEYLPDGYEDPFLERADFNDVRRYLTVAVNKMETLAINSETKETLEYQDSKPSKVIAVGGNRLSRGFTVRGLTVNYFVRKTNYSDTLLQMGRWFGYRPGYLDCCRIYTTFDLLSKFNETTRCIEELEAEFDKMYDARRSPRNFVVKVKKHPGTLKITRPSILKNAVTVKWSYADKLEMTTTLNVHKKYLDEVWGGFKKDIAPLFRNDFTHDESLGLLHTKVSGDEFLKFLDIPNNYDPVTNAAMKKYIEACQSKGKLTNWIVAIKTTGAANQLSSEISGLPMDIQMAKRSGPKKETDRHSFLKEYRFRVSGASANIMSTGRDMAVGLTDEQASRAERDYLKKYRDENPEKDLPKTIPEKVFREAFPEATGVLIIYILDPKHAFNHSSVDPENLDHEFLKFVEEEGHSMQTPLVGYAMGFPKIASDPGAEYMKGDYDLDPFEDDPDEDLDDLTLSADDGSLLEDPETA